VRQEEEIWGGNVCDRIVCERKKKSEVVCERDNCVREEEEIWEIVCERIACEIERIRYCMRQEGETS
jgi:hypothetical protein